MRNVRATGKDVFFLWQISVATDSDDESCKLPFWFGGLIFYFFSREAKAYRVFGFAFVITIAFFMITHGKDYYSAPAYAMFISGRGYGG